MQMRKIYSSFKDFKRSVNYYTSRSRSSRANGRSVADVLDEVEVYTISLRFCVFYCAGKKIRRCL